MNKQLLFGAIVCSCSLSMILAAVSHTVAAELDLRILDADTALPVPARVHLRDQSGRQHLPSGTLTIPVGANDKWFVTDGHTKVELPKGEIEIRVERGTEYVPIKRKISLNEVGTTHLELKLTRWINMQQRGYVCGENHLHVPASELASQLAAEGLDFGTSLQWWNGSRYMRTTGADCFDQLTFAGRTIPCSLCDAEIEHRWGAVYLVGVTTPFGKDLCQKATNLPMVRQAHENGALVCYQGGWSREVLLDALLGLVDVVNLCNNNFHRHQFQPRRNYSNLLAIEGFPEYPNTPEGMMRMNTDTYYRLLNCGLRLAAGAGSATGAKQCPVGYNRAYVRAGPVPSLADYIESWRQGRNFVTNGPMVFLTINDKHQPGATIALAPEGGQLEIRVEAISDQPIQTLELVCNGEVIARADSLSPGTRKAELHKTVTLKSGAWVAARCTAEDRLLADKELDANHRYGKDPFTARPCRLRFGHTSPVYVTVDGRNTRVAKSIAEAKQMLNAFHRHTIQQADPTYRNEIDMALRKAKAFLVK